MSIKNSRKFNNLRLFLGLSITFQAMGKGRWQQGTVGGIKKGRSRGRGLQKIVARFAAPPAFRERMARLQNRKRQGLGPCLSGICG
jgi:hypothetical protein